MKKTYRVYVTRTEGGYVEVEADSSDEAEEEINEMIEEGNNPIEFDKATHYEEDVCHVEEA